MPTAVWTEPIVEPISLAEGKRQCRIDADLTADDLDVAAYIAAARSYAEARYLVAFVGRRCTLTVPATTDAIELLPTPFAGLATGDDVDAVTATLDDGTVVAIASSDYTLTRPTVGATLPVATLRVDTLPADAETLTILFDAGYTVTRTQTAAVADDDVQQVIILEETPLHLVASVTAIDDNDAETPLAVDAYAVETIAGVSTVTVAEVPAGTVSLRVAYTTGIIPAMKKFAVGMLAALFYRERELTTSGGEEITLPTALRTLLQPGSPVVGVH